MTPGETELACPAAENCSGLAPECLGRRLGDRIQRRLGRERLAEHGGDPVEATLDLGLPRAFSYVCALRSATAARLAKPSIRRRSDSSKRPPRGSRRPARPASLRGRRSAHRGLPRTAQPPPPPARTGRLRAGAPAARTRSPRQSSPRRESPAHVRLGQADHGPADELAAFRSKRPAVDRVGVDERPELLDEPVDHHLDPQVARQRLAGLEQRALLGEPPVAVLQQPARVDRDRRFATASASEISPATTRSGAVRWRPSTPIIRPNAMIGSRVLPATRDSSARRRRPRWDRRAPVHRAPR